MAEWNEREFKVHWGNISFLTREHSMKRRHIVRAEHPRTGHRGSRRWTAAEDAILKKKFESEGAAPIAARMNRSRIAVSIRAKRLGLISPRAAKPWTNEDLSQVKRLYPKVPVTRIAEIIGRNLHALHKFIRRSKLHVRQVHTWSEDEDAILRKNYGPKTAEEISKMTGRTIAATRSRVVVLGLKSKRGRRPYKHLLNNSR